MIPIQKPKTWYASCFGVNDNGQTVLIGPYDEDELIQEAERRYRDDGLRTQCRALARRGILKRDWKNYHPGSDRFIAGPNINSILANNHMEEVLVEFEGELRKLEINERTEDPFCIGDQNSECTTIHEVLKYYGKHFWYSLEDYRNGKSQSLFERIKHMTWADADTGEVFEEDLSDLEAK